MYTYLGPRTQIFKGTEQCGSVYVLIDGVSTIYYMTLQYHDWLFHHGTHLSRFRTITTHDVELPTFAEYI